MTDVPVVFISGDPVGAGFAASLAKPGGRATGVSVLSPELDAKRLELLHQLAPRARRVSNLRSLVNPLAGRELETVDCTSTWSSARSAQRPLRKRLGCGTEYDPAQTPDALLVSAEAFFIAHSAKIAQTVRKAKVPAIFPYREYLLGLYVDKILRGANPADLPIEQMSKYELVIDLRAAREMSIHVAQDLLFRADELIK
jgi:putative ABC transport system substrate-binding protein